MSSLGVHFAIEQSVVEQLLTADEPERLRILEEKIEEAWDKEWLYETDKAWDAIHRSLTGGGLEWGSESDPMSNAILGHEVLYGEDDYSICLVRGDLVLEVAKAIAQVNEADLRERYFAINSAEYGPNFGEEDFIYTWQNFSELPAFFAKAAEAGRAVLFAVDQ